MESSYLAPSSNLGSEKKKSKETTISDSCCILNPLVKVRHTAAVQTLDMRFYM